MTEEDAQGALAALYGQAIVGQLSAFVTLVIDEATKQNLIAASTIENLWVRHVLDSAQLVPLATPSQSGAWLDIGTGAGFPGIVSAIITGRETILVEPRRRRADFLSFAAQELDLDNVEVITSKIEAVHRNAAVISARAVANATLLLGSAHHCASTSTLWLLPKGRAARDEVAEARRSWHGVFHVEQSITDPDSLIVIASKVSRR